MMAPSIFARCSAEQLVNRLCQREEVVALTPHAAALLRMLFRSSNVPAKVSQRSLLRNRARGVLVRILKVRPHETQRRRGRPCAAPQRTVWSERQCGQRRLCPSLLSAQRRQLGPRFEPLLRGPLIIWSRASNSSTSQKKVRQR